MRKLTLLLVLLAALNIHAQTPDEAKIKAAALDYAEGWYTGDADRMARALHTDLAKRIVAVAQDGTVGVRSMTAAELVEGTRKGYGKNTPADQQMKDVKILDRFGNAAVVRLEMAGWIDYLQLGKFGEEWKIVNVLWERKPKTK